MTKEVTIKNNPEQDAHFLAEAVQYANRYSSSLHMSCGSTSVNLKSIMGVMSLSLKNGDTFTLTAEGADEQAAISDLAVFFEGR